MSRRNGKGRDGNQEKHGNQTFHVSLEQWQKFQRFCRCEEQLAEAIDGLQNGWTEHGAMIWSEFRESIPQGEIDDNLQMLQDLMRAINYSGDGGRPRKKNKHKNYDDNRHSQRHPDDYAIYDRNPHVYSGPILPTKNNKYNGKARVAIIVVEDISDGKL